MYKINLLRNFILLLLTTTLFIIGIRSPEAADGEEEMEGFRTVTPRRRLKSMPEPMTSYLPPIIVNSPDKSIKECQQRAKLFVTSHSLKTYLDVEELITSSSISRYPSDLINLANHYRHTGNSKATQLATKIFNNIINSDSDAISDRHRSLSYLGLAKIKGRAGLYSEAWSLATRAAKYESTSAIKGFLAMMKEQTEAADVLAPVVPNKFFDTTISNKNKRKRAAF